MNSERLDEIVEISRERQDALLDTKGKDYTRGSDDRLANFKRWGEELDIDPVKVLGVYMGKHIDSVVMYIKTGEEGSEPIESRLDDLHNYTSLLEGMIEEVKLAAVAKPVKKTRKRGRRR